MAGETPTLFHYTSTASAIAISLAGFIRANPALPPRFWDEHNKRPPVVWLTEAHMGSAQRWAGAPSSGIRGLSYVSKSEARIAVQASPEHGVMPRTFRQWALDYDVPFAWIEEFGLGLGHEAWWVLERECPRAEWVEVGVWNGLLYKSRAL